jgi:hypothetical protein
VDWEQIDVCRALRTALRTAATVLYCGLIGLICSYGGFAVVDRLGEPTAIGALLVILIGGGVAFTAGLFAHRVLPWHR